MLNQVMTVLVEWDGGETAGMHRALIDVLGIIGGIRGDVGGVKAERGHGLQIQGMKKGDIAFIER